jgi:hypothetical protein
VRFRACNLDSLPGREVMRGPALEIQDLDLVFSLVLFLDLGLGVVLVVN